MPPEPALASKRSCLFAGQELHVSLRGPRATCTRYMTIEADRRTHRTTLLCTLRHPPSRTRAALTETA
eukprot:611305-Rhodomonas_salina.2